ncbi:MAG: aminopeptidase N, partial [Actinobacteria bacterium]|nr:aminopeptidase N [Actinomycetota bacterium]
VRPAPGAKAEAWGKIVEDDSLSFYEKAAYSTGFALADQADLVRPYVEPYFETLMRFWDTKPPEIAVFFCRGMFPRVLVEDATVASTDSYLEAHPDLPWPLRRGLIEAKDGLARALRARALDVQAGKL